MVIGELLQEGMTALSGAKVETPRLDAEVLLAHLLQQERLYLLIHRDDVVENSLTNSYRKLIKRRATHEPVAYILGHKEFMSLHFSLEPGVLIPRPDTETLVEHIIHTYQQQRISILDLCTGSGAIAVSLAYYLPNASITAYDVSSLCVTVAKKNAEKNGVASRVQVEQQDILKPFSTGECYDCVVSNPPYIPKAEINNLAKDVREYEPRMALEAGDDGLLFYRHIAKTVPDLLAPGGMLALEVGHDQAESVTMLLQKTPGFDSFGVCRDLAGIARVVWCKKAI
ncbi:MAG: peptide chain release factor N(5)-glutamine methyltransferase [Ruminococcaceae bacterium]|nr:peptide chain release factor N(5)-glutamine methyltransferase [Oscillospiraceae bacterium]